MKIANVRFFASMLLFMPMLSHAFTDELCGITKIEERRPGNSGYRLSLNGENEFNASIARNNGKRSFDLHPKNHSTERNNTQTIEAEDGDVVYLTDGKKRGCVVMRGEKHDKRGFYVERHENVMNLPPVLERWFVEAD